MCPFQNIDNENGFSLVELLVVVAIITTIGSLAVPSYMESINHARNVHAIGDLRKIQGDIDVYRVSNNTLPKSLEDLHQEYSTDPWGNPYVYYLMDSGKKSKGQCRKDKFLVPINDDYDLYSMGRDGKSQSPLTAKASRDDIVRASNGSFIGLAENY